MKEFEEPTIEVKLFVAEDIMNATDLSDTFIEDGGEWN